MEVPEPLRSSTPCSTHHPRCDRASLRDMAENYKKDLTEKVNKHLAEIAHYGPESLGAILLDLHNSLQNLDKYMGRKETENQVEATIDWLKVNGDKMFKMSKNLRQMDISEYELDVEQYIAAKEKEEAERAMEAKRLMEEAKEKDLNPERPRRYIISSMRQRMRAAVRAVTRRFTSCLKVTSIIAPTSGEDWSSWY